MEVETKESFIKCDISNQCPHNQRGKIWSNITLVLVYTYSQSKRHIPLLIHEIQFIANLSMLLYTDLGKGLTT